MSNNLSIRFYHNRQKKSGEKFKIYCRITIDRAKSEFYTGFAVSPEAWNDEKRMTDDPEINAELAEIENKIYRVRRSLLDSQISMTASNIIDYYKGNRSTRTYIIAYFSEHIKYIETKGEHSKVTLSQYRATLKILKQFINDLMKSMTYCFWRSILIFSRSWIVICSMDIKIRITGILKETPLRSITPAFELY